MLTGVKPVILQLLLNSNRIITFPFDLDPECDRLVTINSSVSAGSGLSASISRSAVWEWHLKTNKRISELGDLVPGWWHGVRQLGASDYSSGPYLDLTLAVTGREWLCWSTFCGDYWRSKVFRNRLTGNKQYQLTFNVSRLVLRRTINALANGKCCFRNLRRRYLRRACS